MQRIQAIDSHTAGEPTRVVISGGPDLGPGSLVERRVRFQQEQDAFRSTVVNEPRGSDVLVGALLCHPVDASATAGVIFFNNVGYLGMCGHGLIGVVTTLAYLRHIQPGEHRFETPVGDVRATLHSSGEVSIANVPSYRLRRGVPLEVPGFGRVHGDIAWGGNWFFLVEDHGLGLDLENLSGLMDFTARAREALSCAGITADGEEIDHIELTGAASSPAPGGRNFVLCPGLAYDRSPCGTGTSAKLACLAADGKLQPGEVWRQEGILGTSFDGWYQLGPDGRILPTIRGRAYISAETTLLVDPEDPFCHGIRSSPSGV